MPSSMINTSNECLKELNGNNSSMATEIDEDIDETFPLLTTNEQRDQQTARETTIETKFVTFDELTPGAREQKTLQWDHVDPKALQNETVAPSHSIYITHQQKQKNEYKKKLNIWPKKKSLPNETFRDERKATKLRTSSLGNSASVSLFDVSKIQTEERLEVIPKIIITSESNENIETYYIGTKPRRKKDMANYEICSLPGTPKPRKLSAASLLHRIKISPKLPSKIRKRRRKNKSLPLELNESVHELCFSSDTEDNFKIEAHKELSEMYSNLHIQFPQEWLTNSVSNIKIEDIYVKPSLTFNKKAVALKDILIVQPNKVGYNPLIVIKGPPGAGKTSLSQYITHCWTKRNGAIQTLDDVDLFFYVECRFVISDSLMTSLRETYLKNSLDYLSSICNESIMNVLSQLNIIVLLDGFDEGLESSNDLFKRLREYLPDCKIIITARTHGVRNIQEMMDIDKNCDVIEILLNKFDDEQLVEFIDNFSGVFGKTNEDQYALLSQIEHQGVDFEATLQLPLNIVSYLILWVHRKDALKLVSSKAHIFIQIIELMKSQLYHKLGLDRYIDVNHGNRVLNAWILEVGRVCLMCIQARQFYFSPSENNIIIKSTCSAEFNTYLAISVIMQNVSHLSNRNLRVFYHTSIMESFAAVYIDHEMATTGVGLFHLISRQDNHRMCSISCSCACIRFKQAPTCTNVDQKNYQQEDAIDFIVRISEVNNHSSFNLGFDVAKYFPLCYNRNLAKLSNFASLFLEKDNPFRKGLKSGLSKQRLPNPLNSWNIKHVINLIENEAIEPSILIQYTVENNKNWGPTVNELIKLGCRPYINVILEQTQQMQSLLLALEIIEKPRVPKLILHFGLIQVGISELVDIWPYPVPMHILSLGNRYSIEAYIASTTIVNTMGLARVRDVVFAGEESCYVWKLLKKSLPGVRVHLQPTESNNFHIIITTKR